MVEFNARIRESFKVNGMVLNYFRLPFNYRLISIKTKINLIQKAHYNGVYGALVTIFDMIGLDTNYTHVGTLYVPS